MGIERQRQLFEQAASGSPCNATSGNSVGCASRDVSNRWAASSSSGSTMAGEAFAVRRVTHCGRQVPVLLQNRNGPCALLAVANGLLLRGSMRLSGKEDVITSSDL